MTASSAWPGLVAGAAVAALVVVPAVVGAQEADGFDGFIQSGTCAAPTDDLRVNLKTDGDHDVEPYAADFGEGDETVVLGYYGSPEAPGFGVSAVYTDEPFSLVIADTETGDPVACGDLLEPDRDRFAEVGAAVVQLLPVEGSTVQGVAVLQRTRLERELDVTPTRVRVLLTEGADLATPAAGVAGFDGYVQGGTCAAPGQRVRLQLKGRGGNDVPAYRAQPEGSGEPVTLAYYGAPLVPGFGLAAAHTDERFSLVLTADDGGDPVACGDILPPASDDVSDVGRALVELLPVGDAGVQGFGIVERLAMERELDVTPTRVRIVVFAPPVEGS